jgi:pimeloyl-ACP methyl ester carboxylesterase
MQHATEPFVAPNHKLCSKEYMLAFHTFIFKYRSACRPQRPGEKQVFDLRHHIVEANGIRIHVAEQGEGPVIVLCHGFPESWYSWHHQLPAFAAAGFRAVAPDMRGYGDTERPEAIDQYTLLHLVSDMVGLLDALQMKTAVIVGHDWGAPVAWHPALLRPDRFRGVVGLSVPFIPRGQVYPSPNLPQTEDAVFYQDYFQTPGVAEAELERNVRSTIRSFLYSSSADVGSPAITPGAGVFVRSVIET